MGRASLVRRVEWALLVACLGVMGCDRGTTPPDAKAGAKYTVTRETVFFDSGCSHGLGDGKLAKGTTFTLVKAEDGCWNVKLADEDEVYIVPERVTSAN